mmetsp:Transcript_18643/g.27888  ORF Transcript_18643/g.27888 Transcript_18643/m.27888 type:complete len:154 (+) Transcript_18643:51-512(+)|eukprot:CAMPEP_0167758492 /NCGR_PEP_ID=MMETSP0110_2-20121227/10498_1 /TAXON_ID=629695 /ORGANISM="Gymnochlora sp., Strain CCMP2014" /LENGTH=153 /DNA_ID=CAMNT_0007644773 /DNA_START=44 /DNA_END=505 /DNA_ORIENTATION=+
MASNITLFEDKFEVIQVDPDGKKFEKVSRIVCQGESYEMLLVLDVHFGLFKCKVGETINFALAGTIDLTGAKEDDTYDQRQRTTLMDGYQYVMHGRVFQIDDVKGSSDKVIYASFGGLMMSLKGSSGNFTQLEPDMRIYALAKKTDLRDMDVI